MKDYISKGGGALIGIIWFLIGLGFVSLTWTWITTFGDIFAGDSFFYALYYISITALIVVLVFMPPVMLIINTFRDESE